MVSNKFDLCKKLCNHFIQDKKLIVLSLSAVFIIKNYYDKHKGTDFKGYECDLTKKDCDESFDKFFDQKGTNRSLWTKDDIDAYHRYVYNVIINYIKNEEEES